MLKSSISVRICQNQNRMRPTMLMRLMNTPKNWTLKNSWCWIQQKNTKRVCSFLAKGSIEYLRNFSGELSNFLSKQDRMKVLITCRFWRKWLIIKCIWSFIKMLRTPLRQSSRYCRRKMQMMHSSTRNTIICFSIVWNTISIRYKISVSLLSWSSSQALRNFH